MNARMPKLSLWLPRHFRTLRAAAQRRLEMSGLLIAERSHWQLGQMTQAREMSAAVLALAETVKDDARVATASSDLAGIDADLVQYPEALQLRQRAEDIFRRQGDQSSLPYALVNRAEVLTRLGRLEEAEQALAEVDAGIAHGLEAYKGRARRVAALRALGAAIALRCDNALRFASDARPDPAGTDSASLVAMAVTRVLQRPASSPRRWRKPECAAGGEGPASGATLLVRRSGVDQVGRC